MAEVTLNAETGRTLGSRSDPAPAPGREDPGVIYGHGTDPVAVAVEARALRVALSGESGANTLLELKTARAELPHPRPGDAAPPGQRDGDQHVDFQIVRRDEVITTEVPINLVGEALEVQHGDGLVDQLLFTLTDQRQAGRHPDRPRARRLRAHHRFVAAGVRPRAPPGVTTDVDPEPTVVIGQPPRVVGEGEARGRGSRRRGRRRRRAAPRPRPPGRGLGPAPPPVPVRRAGRPSGGARRPTCWSSAWAIPGAEFAGTRHNVGADAVGCAGRAPRRPPPPRRGGCGPASPR